ncbi:MULTISPECIES: rhodanese-like domain-containing protein [Rheinheimera]|uniref:Rhodanese-like domain-containing protein n=1 Tax=Rheinheimera marina TaxID=1774958 RepID=A0ABV9JMJ5_9GAMM
MQQYIDFLSNHPYLTAAWVVLFLALVVSWMKSLTSKIKQISPTELTMLVNRKDATVLDIRSDADFRKGHITGARNITASQIQAAGLPGLENQKDNPIIVVCQAGMSAQGVADSLNKQGFSQVFVLQGGMNSWTGANLPLVKK